MKLLQFVVVAVGALAIAVVLSLGMLSGEPGIGPMQQRALFMGAVIMASGALLRLGVVVRVISPYARLLAGGIVSATLLGGGLAAMELYARHRGGYVPLATPLAKSYFVEKDRVRIYNDQFVSRKAYRFEPWPIPLERLKADVPVPRYVFKPNLRMALRGEHLVPASSDERLFWSSNAA